MTRNPKRSILRKEQSERDRMKHIIESSGYQQSLQDDLCTRRIPLELIDLAGAWMASWNDENILVQSAVHAYESWRSHVNFIRRTLVRAQTSCSSLVVCLWYMDQLCHGSRHVVQWKQPRDLFMACIVVADKFLDDVTWTNLDWVDHTLGAYSLQQINNLERQLMGAMQYRLFVPHTHYDDFCAYLDFRVHARQLNPFLATGLSYHDINVLSQSLVPLYADRLKFTLRPMEAMMLLAKIVTGICVVYAATVAAMATVVVSTEYMLAQSQWTMAGWETHLQEHIVTLAVDWMIRTDGLAGSILENPQACLGITCL
ncbi:hypothetical protein J3Q64DRAFT_1695645 [Phycomyces blakesleeanus]|uniref:Cyclin N-terminal domain-containing protein n=2 Tax=Phycomyces blakesleeanus TaxID=4837 RepID=A0A162V6P5_PHYB8|nr:hypothetical protein PHYBLDRAFT_137948 [Phycomyces blakesleeanus NRRL 1555(-)]OAD80393.1 hypothetical protein PHYBLDRAFT_137948 [Phycomyces blakesleeanus NRRL 1555(-)]|eukprot:XP_018298433.1 hypothetical protein PHYBLDRAFT_137948 [Phycomyces blakesleeanus NRRL 1555(-)]